MMDRVIENKAKKRRTILWISITGLFTGFVLYILFFTDHSSRLNIDRDALSISEVVRKEFLDYMSASGFVEIRVASHLFKTWVSGGILLEVTARRPIDPGTPAAP